MNKRTESILDDVYALIIALGIMLVSLTLIAIEIMFIGFIAAFFIAPIVLVVRFVLSVFGF